MSPAGMVTRNELEAAGIGRRQRRALVERGQLRPIARGRWRWAGADAADATDRERWLDQVRVELARHGRTAVLARQGAAALRGLDGFEPPVPITVNVAHGHPTGSARRARPVGEQTTTDGIPTTSIEQTLLELGIGLRPRPGCTIAGWDLPTPRVEQLVELALESALRHGLVDQRSLWNLVGTLPKQRRGRDLLEALLLQRGAGAPATESYLETRGIQVLRDAGLPTGECQVELTDAKGTFVARVDLLLEGRVVIEFDGRATHEQRFEEDRDRRARIVALGYVVLEFTLQQVELQPRHVRTRVAETLAAHARSRT